MCLLRGRQFFVRLRRRHDLVFVVAYLPQPDLAFRQVAGLIGNGSVFIRPEGAGGR